MPPLTAGFVDESRVVENWLAMLTTSVSSTVLGPLQNSLCLETGLQVTGPKVTERKHSYLLWTPLDSSNIITV